MSTYYAFGCKQCKEYGGFISQQACGWGNFDIVDSFKFIALHISKCGHENVCIISEHDTAYEEYADMSDENNDRLRFLEDTAHIFPRSNDWSFMKENAIGFKEAWVKAEKEKV